MVVVTTTTMTATRAFNAAFTSPDTTTTTCARDGGRDDTAPYWTALRKYNGAPLLRCVYPNLGVGVGATPLPRSAARPSPVGTGPSVPLLPILLSSILHRPRSSSATTTVRLPPAPAVLAALLLAVILLFLSLSPSRRGGGDGDGGCGRSDPRRALPEGCFFQRGTSATARFRCTSMATSVHAPRARRDAKGSFSRRSEEDVPVLAACSPVNERAGNCAPALRSRAQPSPRRSDARAR